MPMPLTPAAAPSDAQTQPVPVPVHERRDQHGRRVALTFHATVVPPVAPSSECWCVAIDGSRHAMQALSQAMQLAADSGVHTLDLGTVHHWLSTEAAETELAHRGWATSADARALLDARGFAWRLHVLMGEPAKCLVQLTESLGSRGIVLGARGLSAVEGLLLGSVAQNIISHAQGAVLLARAPATPAEPAPC